MDAAPMLKRKGAEPPPEPWLDDGVLVPATKTRRLDSVVVPPVEPGAVFAQTTAGEVEPFEVAEEVPVSGEVEPAVVLTPTANDDERAIVVYQPAEAARGLLHGPLRPEPPLRVSPDWIRSIKGTVLQEANHHHHRALVEELASRDEMNPDLAMVPWTPRAHLSQNTTGTTYYSSAPATEMMVDADQDDEGASSMEVEASQPAPPPVAAMYGQAFHHHHQQWPTQHCMAPQQLQVPAASYSYHPSAVTWSW